MQEKGFDLEKQLSESLTKLAQLLEEYNSSEDYCHLLSIVQQIFYKQSCFYHILIFQIQILMRIAFY